MRKTILSVAAFVLFILVMTGCEMVKTTEELTPKLLTLLTTEKTVSVGATYTLPTTGTVTYTDGTTKTVKVTWDKTVSTVKAGITTYTASYTENEITVVAEFKLEVEENEVVTNAELASLKLAYDTATVNAGASYALPTTGTATYSDGTTKTVTLVWDKAVSTTTAGTTTYTASYTENSIKKSATFNLVVVIVSIKPTFTIEDVTASVNGTVEVTVKASGFTTGAAGVDLRLYADSTYLTYSSAEFTGVAVGGLTIAKTDDKNASNIILANIPSSPIILDGTIIKIKFTAIKTGNTTVNMTFSKLLDSKGLELEATDISDTATVTIK